MRASGYTDEVGIHHPKEVDPNVRLLQDREKGSKARDLTY
jgi:hypothetical protein